jgi:hypothetical protein
LLRAVATAEDDFRYSMRCILQQCCDNILIRLNYLNRTQRFYVGGS